MHSSAGKIVSIDAHSNGTHATITVRHGKRKRSKDEKGQPIGDLVHYSQPESRLHLLKGDAAGYKLGQRVNAGISPSTDQGEPGDEDGEDNDNVATEPQATPGKQVAPSIGKKASSTAKTRIAAAMGKKR